MSIQMFSYLIIRENKWKNAVYVSMNFSNLFAVNILERNMLWESYLYVTGKEKYPSFKRQKLKDTLG